MTLDESTEIGGFDFPDISLIDLASRYRSCSNQFAEPFRFKFVALVVVRTHSYLRADARPFAITHACLFMRLRLSAIPRRSRQQPGWAHIAGWTLPCRRPRPRPPKIPRVRSRVGYAHLPRRRTHLPLIAATVAAREQVVAHPPAAHYRLARAVIAFPPAVAAPGTCRITSLDRPDIERAAHACAGSGTAAFVNANNLIFGATIFFGTDTFTGRAAMVQRCRFNFMREAQIWYSRDPDQRALSSEFENVIVLSDEFYQELIAHPVPNDLDAVKVLAASPAVLDLFM
jgi:hypothetical protein